MAKAQPTEEDAKRLAVAIRNALPDEKYLLTEVHAEVSLRTETGGQLLIKMDGVPPFNSVDVILNGNYVATYVGHPEHPSITDS